MDDMAARYADLYREVIADVQRRVGVSLSNLASVGTEPEPLVTSSQMNPVTIREIEIASIRDYVVKNASYLRGRVLDFGAGKAGTCRQPQPYRGLVQGEYFPFDVGDELPPGPFDAVLMTQVIQYLPDPRQTLSQLESLLRSGAALVITGPTNWAEVEETDLWRFTRSGIRVLLETAGFHVLDVQQRAQIDVGGFVMSLGWGAVAVKP